jgi:hypothetical protein
MSRTLRTAAILVAAGCFAATARAEPSAVFSIRLLLDEALGPQIMAEKVVPIFTPHPSGH